MNFPLNQGLFELDVTDHYAVLGLPITAPPKDVRKRYLKIANNLHPDKLLQLSPPEKEQASQILSKLVNPAYQALSKDQSRNELQLIFSQTGKRVAQTGLTVSLKTDLAQNLMGAGPSLDNLYEKSIKTLAQNQYKNLTEAIALINAISELNLVYLKEKQGQGIRQNQPAKPAIATASSLSQGQGQTQANPSGSSPTARDNASTIPNDSPISPYLRRAETYLAQKNEAKALIELKNAIRLDPNSSTAHGLMGLVYIQAKQITMAKVHITKACQANPQDPIAQKARQAYEKVTGKTTSGDKVKGQKAKEKKGGGFLSGLFGAKKK